MVDLGALKMTRVNVPLDESQIEALLEFETLDPRLAGLAADAVTMHSKGRIKGADGLYLFVRSRAKQAGLSLHVFRVYELTEWGYTLDNITRK